MAPSTSATRSTRASFPVRGCRCRGRPSISEAPLSYPSLLPPFQEGPTEGKNVNSPWLARAAVREAKLHGVDWIKIYTTEDFVGSEYRVFKPDGTLVNSPSLTLEEVQAIVDEAHRLGLKVACHAYGGEGLHSCIAAGVDATQHALGLDDDLVRMLLRRSCRWESRSRISSPSRPEI